MSQGATWGWLYNLVAILAVGVTLLIWFGRKQMLGTELKITDHESVNYSGSVTEEEARRLGTMLQEAGYFNGQSESDVLYFRSDRDGTRVSFVVQSGAWDQPETVSAFEAVGRTIAKSVGGAPFELRLLDAKLNTRKTLQIEQAEWTLKVTPEESVTILEPATGETALKLGKLLQDLQYFDGQGAAQVYLRQADGHHVISMVVRDGTAEDEKLVAVFSAIRKALASGLPDENLVLELINPDRKLMKSLPGTTVSDQGEATPAPDAENGKAPAEAPDLSPPAGLEQKTAA